MTILRDATLAEATAISELIRDLADSMDESSPITPSYVEIYLAYPGCHILLAEEQGQITGMLSYSIRPNLYHNGETALIEELIVKHTWRDQGVGGRLLDEVLYRLEASGCAEVSVTTLADNLGAIRFYRAHGLVDEAIYLEKHF
jgi:ribosomal protein S18 acetylase RimI-like enzyme